MVVWFGWRRLINMDDDLGILHFFVSVCMLMIEKMSVINVVPNVVGD